MNHYAINLLLKQIGDEPDPQKAMELAKTYVKFHLDEFGENGAFDAGVDLGYINFVRIRNGRPELDFKGMDIPR